MEAFDEFRVQQECNIELATLLRSAPFQAAYWIIVKVKVDGAVNGITGRVKCHKMAPVQSIIEEPVKQELLVESVAMEQVRIETGMIVESASAQSAVLDQIVNCGDQLDNPIVYVCPELGHFGMNDCRAEEICEDWVHRNFFRRVDWMGTVGVEMCETSDGYSQLGSHGLDVIHLVEGVRVLLKSQAATSMAQRVLVRRHTIGARAEDEVLGSGRRSDGCVAYSSHGSRTCPGSIRTVNRVHNYKKIAAAIDWDCPTGPLGFGEGCGGEGRLEEEDAGISA